MDILEIEIDKCISHEEVYEYVNELTMFFQLLKPCKFDIDKIVVEIEGFFYELCFPTNEIKKYKNSHVNNSVKENLLQFYLNAIQLFHIEIVEMK